MHWRLLGCLEGCISEGQVHLRLWSRVRRVMSERRAQAEGLGARALASWITQIVQCRGIDWLMGSVARSFPNASLLHIGGQGKEVDAVGLVPL